MPDNDDFDELTEPVKDIDGLDEDAELYRVSEQGLEALTNWVRYSVQLWEAMGAPEEDFNEIKWPLLVGFLIPEVCFYRGIPLPGGSGISPEGI